MALKEPSPQLFSSLFEQNHKQAFASRKGKRSREGACPPAESGRSASFYPKSKGRGFSFYLQKSSFPGCRP